MKRDLNLIANENMYVHSTLRTKIHCKDSKNQRLDLTLDLTFCQKSGTQISLMHCVLHSQSYKHQLLNISFWDVLMPPRKHFDEGFLKLLLLPGEVYTRQMTRYMNSYMHDIARFPEY